MDNIPMASETVITGFLHTLLMRDFCKVKFNLILFLFGYIFVAADTIGIDPFVGCQIFSWGKRPGLCMTICTYCILGGMRLGFTPHLKMFSMAGASEGGTGCCITNQPQHREATSNSYSPEKQNQTNDDCLFSGYLERFHCDKT